MSWDREDPWVKKELQEGARLDFLPAGGDAKGWNKVSERKETKLAQVCCGDLPTAWVARPG